jgi:hypothetical protein
MADPKIPTSPHFRFGFVDHLGFGSCDNCNQEGPVNRLCLRCCVAEGMILGICFVCSHKGPVWYECDWCEAGEHMPPVFGMCDNCEKRGPGGKACECGDGTYDISLAEKLEPHIFE